MIPFELTDVLDEFESAVDYLMDMLEAGRITAVAWEEAMQVLLARYHGAAMMVGMGITDLPELAQALLIQTLDAGQYPYLENFKRVIVAAGDEFKEAWRSRARMYAQSAKQSFWEGRVWKEAGGRFLPLPAMPAQGTNCYCITTPESRVWTHRGYVPIKDVQVGDWVLTHKMRWRPVLRTFVHQPKPHHRQAYIKLDNGRLIGCTTDHKWLTPDGWEQAINIHNSTRLMYNVPYEELHKMRHNFREQKQVGNLPELQAGLRLWSHQGSQGTAVSILPEQDFSKSSMGIQGGQGQKDGRVKKGREGTAQEVRRFAEFGCKLAHLAGEGGREKIHVLLEKREASVHLPLPVDLDSEERRNTGGISNPSQGWRPHKRHYLESSTDDGWRTRQPAYDSRTGQVDGKGSRKPVHREKRVDLFGMRGSVSWLAEECWERPDVLLTGVLQPGTLLYDIEVAEDHSFILEGIITHNSNCGCAWRIVILDDEKGNYDAYWERSKDDSCQTCVQREREWYPLKIRGGDLLLETTAVKHADHDQSSHGRRGVTAKPRSDYDDHGQESLPALVDEILGDPRNSQDLQRKWRDAQDDMDRKLTGEYSGWFQGLSGEEVSAIRTYTGNFYKYANGVLRGQTKLEHLHESDQKLFKETRDGLDSALAKGKAPRDLMMYRGGNRRGFADMMRGVEPGQIWSDDGYLSTSAYKHTWNAFTAGAMNNERQVSMRIRVPKGSPGGYIEEYGGRVGEFEFLLPRGSSFYVNEVKVGAGGGVELDMTLLPQGVREKHLSGKHDQSAHGRRGGVPSAAQAVIDKPDSDFFALRDYEPLDRMRSRHEGWFDTLDLEERTEVKDYTGASYINLNQYLRGKIEPTVREKPIWDEKIAVLDRAIERGRLDEDRMLFRGVNSKSLRAQLEQAGAGGVFTDPGFGSTTVRRLKATEFMGPPGEPGAGNPKTSIMLQIRAPKGSPGAFLGMNSYTSHFPEEGEFVFPRNSAFYINEMKYTQNGTLAALVTLLPREGTAVKHADHDQSSHGRRGTAAVVNRPIDDYKTFGEVVEYANNYQVRTGPDPLIEKGGYNHREKNADAELKEMYGDFYNGLSVAERDAFSHYTQSLYNNINATKRGLPKKEFVQESLTNSDGSPFPLGKEREDAAIGSAIQQMDAAFARSSVPADIVVYRGLQKETRGNEGYGFPPDVLAQMKPGSVFTEPGYMSTSIVKRKYGSFPPDGTSSSADLSFRIRVPKGAQGIWLGSELSFHPQELEFLLPAGTAYYINEVATGKNGATYVDMTVIPPGTAVKHADHDQSTHGRRGGGGIAVGAVVQANDAGSHLKRWGALKVEEVKPDGQTVIVHQVSNPKQRLSVPVNYLELQEVNPRIRVYHGTSEEVISQIKQNGLRPFQADSIDAANERELLGGVRPASVYFTTDKAMAQRYADGHEGSFSGHRSAIIEIDLPDDVFSRAVRDEMGNKTDFRIESPIPPEWIREIKLS